MAIGELRVISGSANPHLAAQICESLGRELTDCLTGTFSDGEIRVEIGDNVRGADVYVVQSTCSPVNFNLMELCILLDALKRSSVARVTAVIPYYGYARQDRKVASRAPITAKLVADFLTTAGIDRLVTVDLHAGQIQGFFNIPVDNLFAAPVLLQGFADIKEDLVVVSPDAGGVERARAYAKRLNAGLAIIDKRRDAPNKAKAMNLIGSVKGKVAVVLDDMIDTAGTIVAGAKVLWDNGAKDVFAAATHAVLSGPAVERLCESGFSKVVVTDSIPLSAEAKACSKIEVRSLASLLGKAIHNIHTEASVSELFNYKKD